MISRATMNLKPAVIELDFGPSSKRPFWIRSGCVCAVHSAMSALGQKRTFALHQPMSALPPIARSIAFFSMSALGARDRVARRAEAQVLRRRAHCIATECTGYNLNYDVDEYPRHMSLPCPQN